MTPGASSGEREALRVLASLVNRDIEGQFEEVYGKSLDDVMLSLYAAPPDAPSLRAALERLQGEAAHMAGITDTASSNFQQGREYAFQEALILLDEQARAALAAEPPATGGLDVPDFDDEEPEPYPFTKAVRLMQRIEQAISKDYHHHDLHADVKGWLDKHAATLGGREAVSDDWRSEAESEERLRWASGGEAGESAKPRYVAGHPYKEPQP